MMLRPVVTALSEDICMDYQGRRKQSADGQAQLDVDGEVANNLRAKFWT